MVVVYAIVASFYLTLLIGRIVRRRRPPDAYVRPPQFDADSAAPWSRWRRRRAPD